MTANTDLLLSCKYSHEDSKPQRRYMTENKVSPSYHGAVYVVEAIWAPCGRCTMPVDAVSRVRVGSQSFHPQCLRCAICDRPSKANIFKAVKGKPVCQECFTRGFKLPKEDTTTELGRYPSPGLSPTRALRSASASRAAIAASASRRSATGLRLPSRAQSRRSTREPPLLIGPPSPYRGCTPRAQALLDRQTAYMQNDPNVLNLPSIPSPARREEARPGTTSTTRSLLPSSVYTPARLL